MDYSNNHGIRLNEIPLDLFMRYFNKDTLALDRPVEIPKRQVPYVYKCSDYPDYTYYFTKQIRAFDTKSDDAITNPMEIPTFFPFKYELEATGLQSEVLKMLEHITFTYNNRSVHITDMSQPHATIAEALDYDNRAKQVYIAINEDGEMVESFYKFTMMIRNTVDIEMIADYFILSEVTRNGQPIGSYIMVDIRHEPEDLVLSVEECVAQNRVMWEPVAGQKNTYQDPGDKDRLLVIAENMEAMETKTLQGSPLFLDAEGNEVTINMGLQSNFQQHHNLFAAPSDRLSLETACVNMLGRNVAGIVTQAGADRIYGYSSATLTATVTKVNPTSEIANSAEYGYGSLEQFIAEDYFHLLSDGGVSPDPYIKTEKAYKIVELFDFNIKERVKLIRNPKVDEKVTDPQEFLMLHSSEMLPDGFHIGQYEETIIDGSNKTINKTNYVIYIYNKKLDYIGKNNRGGFEPSDVKFTIDEMYANFGLDKSDFNTTTNTMTRYYYDEVYRVYFKREIKLQVDPWQISSGQSEKDTLNTFLYSSFDHNISSSEIGVDIPKIIRGTTNSLYNPNDYTPLLFVELNGFKNRFSEHKSSTDGSKPLAPNGAFRKKRLELLTTMNLEQYNRLNNEAYTIENSYVDSDAPMKMFIYMNGLNLFLAHEIDHETNVMDKRQLIDFNDANVDFLIREQSISDTSLNDYSSQKADVNKQLMSDMEQLNAFQRLNGFNNYGLAQDQIDGDTIIPALAKYIEETKDSTDHVWNILENYDRTLYKYKDGRLSFAPFIINLFTGYYENYSAEYPENFERFFKDKLYDADGNFIPPVYTDRDDLLPKLEKYNSKYDTEQSTLNSIKNKVLKSEWEVV